MKSSSSSIGAPTGFFFSVDSAASEETALPKFRVLTEIPKAARGAPANSWRRLRPIGVARRSDEELGSESELFMLWSNGGARRTNKKDDGAFPVHKPEHPAGPLRGKYRSFSLFTESVTLPAGGGRPAVGKMWLALLPRAIAYSLEASRFGACPATLAIFGSTLMPPKTHENKRLPGTSQRDVVTHGLG